MRRELEISPETFALLFVGELVVPRKGLRTVLEAMQQLPETVHLFVVGDGSPAAYGAALRGIEARAHFLGFRSDVHDLYAAMDCFTYPTRYDACCLVVLEALASGLPVITTLESGSGELIELDETESSWTAQMMSRVCDDRSSDSKAIARSRPTWLSRAVE